MSIILIATREEGFDNPLMVVSKKSSQFPSGISVVRAKLSSTDTEAILGKLLVATRIDSITESVPIEIIEQHVTRFPSGISILRVKLLTGSESSTDEESSTSSESSEGSESESVEEFRFTIDTRQTDRHGVRQGGTGAASILRRCLSGRRVPEVLHGALA